MGWQGKPAHYSLIGTSEVQFENNELFQYKNHQHGSCLGAFFFSRELSVRTLFCFVSWVGITMEYEIDYVYGIVYQQLGKKHLIAQSNACNYCYLFWLLHGYHTTTQANCEKYILCMQNILQFPWKYRCLLEWVITEQKAYTANRQTSSHTEEWLLMWLRAFLADPPPSTQRPFFQAKIAQIFCSAIFEEGVTFKWDPWQVTRVVLLRML